MRRRAWAPSCGTWRRIVCRTAIATTPRGSCQRGRTIGPLMHASSPSTGSQKTAGLATAGKRAGEVNVRYLRYGRWFLLIATGPCGEHHFFEEEVDIRDVQAVPIRFHGYELSYRDGRVWVRIGEKRSAPSGSDCSAGRCGRGSRSSSPSFSRSPSSPIGRWRVSAVRVAPRGQPPEEGRGVGACPRVGHPGSQAQLPRVYGERG